MSQTDAERQAFANQVSAAYDSAMDRFFTKVEDERQRRGASVADTTEMLELGYGDDVANEWCEWQEEGKS